MKLYEYKDSLGNQYNEGLHNIYSSPNDVRVARLRRMPWRGYVLMKKMRNAYKISVGSTRREDAAWEI
jgi:uncharacterized protein (DUF427 family)